MNFEGWIHLAVYGGSLLVFVAINAYKFAQLATKEELREKEKTRNQMIDRVYERFDEHKRDCQSLYVRRDMCTQLHDSSKDEMARIDEEYKDFRHEIRNQVQQIFDKIDQLKELVQKK